MAALQGRLRRSEIGIRHGGGDVVPVGGAEVSAIERHPSRTIGVDQGYGLVLGPARRRDPSRRDGRNIRHNSGSGGGGGGGCEA